VALCGPARLGYHDTSKDSIYFYFNFTTFGKTFWTMWLSYTSTNYPDFMVFKWASINNGERVIFGCVFCVYLFLSVFIVQNVLVAIFYSKYKEFFTQMISNFSPKDQHNLRNIMDVTTDKSGNMNCKDLVKLVDLYYLEEQWMYEKE